MDKCINTKHPEFIELAKQANMNPLVLKSKIGVWQERNNSDEFPTLEEILNPNEANYQLKIVNALINLTIPRSDTRYAMAQRPEVLTLRLNSKQQPYIEINIRKRLRGKGVNDTQIDFIFDYMKSNNIQEISTEELALELASKYGYTVEINKSIENRVEQIGNIDKQKWNKRVEELAKQGFSIEERRSILEKEFNTISIPTSYYSDLTVPGGTNYTENEIATPLITPSIKGHAQFSTDKGIGWFRSDDATTGDKNKYYGEYENENLEAIYDNFVDAGLKMSFQEFKVEYKKQNSGKLLQIKTRRILEVQSDLFQKGRDKENLNIDKKLPYVKNIFESTIKNIEGNIDNYKKALEAIKTNDYRIILPNNDGRYVASVESTGVKAGTIPIAENPYTKEAKEGKFDIEYAVKYLKERIKKEESFIADEKEKYKESEKIINKNIENNKFLQLLNKDSNWVTFFIKSIIQDSAKKGYEKVLFPKGETAGLIEGFKDAMIKYKELESKKNKGETLTSSEIEAMQQFEKAQKNVTEFYEIKIGNILEKLFGKENIKTITDEFGNQWREVTTDKKRDLSPILLQKSETKKKVSINKLAKQLNKRFNVEAEIISQEKAKELNPKYNGEPSFFDVSQSKAYLVEGIADKTSTVHEIFTHPFLIKIEKDDNELYNNLLKEAKSDQDIVSFVEENYAGYSDKTKDHEIIARAIDLQVQGKLDSEKHKNLIEVIMDFFSQLASTLKEIFNTEKEITSLSTLEDVVTLVLEGKSFINLNTLGIKTETENTMFQIIGLKAIENIKDPELKKNLEDKLKKAKELEKKGENPDYIWEVTHFERGEDGLWRLEVADVEFDAKVFESHKNNTPNEEVNIEHYIGKESPFFELYPELKDVKVELMEGVVSAYNEREKTLKLSKEKTKAEVYFDFLHEFQHFIQEREGFSLGGNDEFAFRMLPRKVFDKVFEDSKQRIFRSLEKSVRKQLKNPQKLTTQEETILRNMQKVIELSNNNLLDYQDKVELLDYMFQHVEMREDNPIDKYLIYLWLLGEREATNTKERAKLSMQERMKIRPTKSMPEAPDFSKFFVTKKMITSSLVSTAFQKEFIADLDLFCSYFSVSYPFQEFVKTHNGLVKLTKEGRLSDNGRLCNAYYSIDKKRIFVAKEATGKDLFSAVLEYYLLENEDIDVQDILFDMVDKINSRDNNFKVSSTDDLIHNLFINEKMKDFLKTQESTMEEYKNLFDEFISVVAEKGALKKQGVLDILKRNSRVEVTDYFAAEKKLRDYPDVFSMEVLNNIEEC